MLVFMHLMCWKIPKTPNLLTLWPFSNSLPSTALKITPYASLWWCVYIQLCFIISPQPEYMILMNIIGIVPLGTHCCIQSKYQWLRYLQVWAAAVHSRVRGHKIENHNKPGVQQSMSISKDKTMVAAGLARHSITCWCGTVEWWEGEGYSVSAMLKLGDGTWLTCDLVGTMCARLVIMSDDARADLSQGCAEVLTFSKHH